MHDETPLEFQRRTKSSFRGVWDFSTEPGEAREGEGSEVSQIMAIKSEDSKVTRASGHRTAAAAEWRRIREGRTGLKRKGGKSQRCVFIPPSDLLFCTVNQL